MATEPFGMVMTAEFELNGQKFLALNGGPEFTFTEAISFQIPAPTRMRSITTGIGSPRTAVSPARAAG